MRLFPLLLALPVLLLACEPDASPSEAPVEAEVPAFRGDLTSVDDGAETEGFASLRDSLRAVVARRDTAALLALVAPDARLSFGDTPGGPDGFRALWFEGAPDEPIWDLLPRLLDGGSVEEDGAVIVPAIATLWPESLDPFANVAIPGDDVTAFDAPDGTPLATLSRTTLPTSGPAADGWRPVTLPDGRAAVVPEPAVLSPVGYRATFWDDGDGWHLRSFLTGD